MPNTITSPAFSIVNFNDPTLYCGDEKPFPLPAPAGVGFQIQLPADIYDDDAADFYLSICDEDCNNITGSPGVPDQLLASTPICYKYRWENDYDLPATFPAADKYPVLVNDCYGSQPFLGGVPYAYATEADLLDAVSDALGVTISSWDEFTSCCQLREDVCLLMTDIDTTEYTANLRQYIDKVAFVADTFNIASYVDNGNCFRYCVYYTPAEQIGCSNLFYRDDQDCYRTTIKYYSNDDSFGFNYPEGIYNMARFPMYLRKPDFPTEERIYRLSNGNYRRQFAIVEKEWDVFTDYLPEWLHERLVIALKHDTVLITSPDAGLTTTQLTQLGGYDILWQEKEDVYAPAAYKLRQPVAGMNRSCRSQAACCIPHTISSYYVDTEAGTGFFYFAMGSNATAVQVRYRLSTDTAWTTVAAEAATAGNNSITFDYLPLTPCSPEYYEVQFRSICDTITSNWSPTEIVRDVTACPEPVLQSIASYFVAPPGVGADYGITFQLTADDNIGTYTVNLYLSAVLKGTATSASTSINIDMTAEALGGRTYDFEIISNCGGIPGCQITGTVTLIIDFAGAITILSWTID